MEKKEPKVNEEIEQLEELLQKEDEEEASADHMRILIVSAAILIVAAALILILLVVFKPFNAQSQKREEKAVTSEQGAEQISVPNIVGLTAQEAEAVLSEKQLGIKYKGEETSDEEEGVIIRQSPKAGEKAAANDTVTYIRSSGPEYRTMPEVNGKHVSDAMADLSEEGFDNVKVESVYTERTKLGKVISVNVPAEQRIKSSTEIMLTVSAGDRDGTVNVADFVGKKARTAKRDAEKVGIIVRIIYGKSDIYQKDEVMAQDITPFSTVVRGSMLTLTVSEGAASEGEGAMQEGKKVTLNAPDTYHGRRARLVLERRVNGKLYEILLADESHLTFPYEIAVPESHTDEEAVLRLYENDGEAYHPCATWDIATFQS